MSGNKVGGFDTSAIGFGCSEELRKKQQLPEPRCRADLADPKYLREVA